MLNVNFKLKIYRDSIIDKDMLEKNIIYFSSLKYALVAAI